MYSVIIWISYIAYAVIESTLDAWKSKRGGVIDHGTINWSVIFRISSAIGASFISLFVETFRSPWGNPALLLEANCSMSGKSAKRIEEITIKIWY